MHFHAHKLIIHKLILVPEMHRSKDNLFSDGHLSPTRSRTFVYQNAFFSNNLFIEWEWGRIEGRQQT